MMPPPLSSNVLRHEKRNSAIEKRNLPPPPLYWRAIFVNLDKWS